MAIGHRLPILICAVLQWSCSTPGGVSPRPVASPVAAIDPQFSLLSCIRDGVTGLHSLENKEDLPSKFHAFSEYRKKAGIEDSRRGYDGCVAELRDNPFCSALSSEASRAPASPSRGEKRAEFRRVVRYLKAGDLEGIRKSDGEALRAAYRTPHLGSAFKRLGEQLLTVKGDCELVTANLLLGARAEESSPEPEYLQTALEHYGRAAECPDSDDGERALYRMGLIQYWLGMREAADQHLRKVIARSNGEFKARALFWLQQIHQDSGSVAVAQEFRAALKAQFPFSLHHLLAQEKYEKVRVADSLQADSAILYRSKARPDLDPWVGAAEYLLKEGRTDLATPLLNSVSRRLDGAEPGFQLYLAVLFHRAGDYLGKFRLLSALFRDAPQVVSKPALELYYPKESVLTSVEPKLDELLVLSLIRQESAFNKRARSIAGAIGLMQVMPSTARLIDRKTNRSRLYQVDHNVRIGSEYFWRLLQKFDGDAELALAAYNAGSKRVEDWLKRYPIENRMLFVDLIPFKETREYVAAITRNYYWYTRLYQQNTVAENQAESKARLFKLLN